MGINWREGTELTDGEEQAEKRGKREVSEKERIVFLKFF